MRRPPALKAIVAIYATDDRYTDDVHFMGGSLRLLDLIDYPTYMIAMNALPPVPRVFGDGWREEWARRLDATPPWLLRWLDEQIDSEYWRHGSLAPDYGRITAATMIVAGWADGYRNNSFRTYRALTAAGTPTRLLVGPWSHMSAATSLPGPHLDIVAEQARWFDRWLRADTEPARAANGIGASGDPPGGEASIVYFARHSDAALARRHRGGRSVARRDDAGRRPESRTRTDPSATAHNAVSSPTLVAATPAPRPGTVAPDSCRTGSLSTSVSTTPRR